MPFTFQIVQVHSWKSSGYQYEINTLLESFSLNEEHCKSEPSKDHGVNMN